MRRTGGGQHGLGRQQIFAFNTGVVSRALRAVRAIFGTAAGLDAEQRAALNGLGIVMTAMNGLCPKEQLGQRQMIEIFYASGRPIVPDVHGPVSYDELV